MVVGGYNPALVTFFAAILLTASMWDLARRRIPNPLSAGLALSGLGAQLLTHGWRGGLSGLGAGLIIGALLWIPWSRGGLGGGDLKLAAAAAVWLGVQRLVGFVLAGAVVGGVVATGCYLFSTPAARRMIRGNMLSALLMRSLPSVEAGGEGEIPERLSVPYALAIAAGALYALLLFGGEA